MTSLLAFAVSLLVALSSVPLLRQVALRYDLVAHPKADRWHRGAIPLLGGLAMMLGAWAGLAATGALTWQGFLVLAAATALGLVGLFDDVRPMRPSTKLATQIIVAAWVVAMGLRLELSTLVLVDIGLTMIWLVALTNAFNLLDNMDGLAAGIAAIALASRLVIVTAAGNAQAEVLVVGLLGAALGFLVFNFVPARIFMGDSGSMFLGFAVAGTSLVGEWPYSRATSATVALPFLLTVVPLFDAVFVTIARTLAGRPIYVGGRDHTSHRLVALGLSERRAVLSLYGIAVMGGLIAYTSYRYGWTYGGVLTGLLLVTLVLLGTFLSRSPAHGVPQERMDALATWIETSDLAWLRGLATVVVDAMLVVFAYYTAFLLKFDDQLPAAMPQLLRTLPFVIGAQMTTLLLARAPQQVWRLIGLPDLTAIAQGTLTGAGLSAALLTVVGEGSMPVYTVVVIDFGVLTMVLCAARLSFRLLSQHVATSTGALEPVLIYGAGKGGVMVLREIRDNRELGWNVVGFIDDDPAKQRARIQGVPVLGGSAYLEEFLATRSVRHVIISSQKIDETVEGQLVHRCEPFGSRVVRAQITFD